jgi:TonB family protein
MRVHGLAVAVLLTIACGPKAVPSAEPLRDGGDRVFVEAEVDTHPKPIDIPMPEYPEDLHRRGVEGNAVVEYVIAKDGRVEDATIRVLSATEPAFGKSASRVIREARFQPAQVGGQPVRIRWQQVIRFQIGSH